MIAIVDYGMGNLRSVEKALHKLGHAAEITADAAAIRAAERVILPGVGAFGAAMANLSRPTADGPTLRESVEEAARSGKPFLGICLGMQLLLSESEELGCHRGLDVIPGEVLKFDFHTSDFGVNKDAQDRQDDGRTLRSPSSCSSCASLFTLKSEIQDLKVPHMGWNRLRIERASPLLAGIPDGAMVYFVHSYYCRPADVETVAATTEHGIAFCSSLWRENIVATQFHPEKSGEVGLRMLDNFARL
jgi:glutamine amidotransferase